MKLARALLALFVCAYGASAQAPTPGANPAGRIIGEVTSVDSGAQRLMLKPDKGDPVTVALAEKTVFLRVPPGEKDLKKATRIGLSDIGAGDRVLARGQLSE